MRMVTNLTGRLPASDPLHTEETDSSVEISGENSTQAFAKLRKPIHAGGPPVFRLAVNAQYLPILAWGDPSVGQGLAQGTGVNFGG